MLNSGIYSAPGLRHRNAGQPNEDAAEERICGRHRVVVLCDGASHCTHGRTAAQLTASAVAEYLACRFEHCLLEKEDVLRRELVHVISTVLTDAAHQSGADPSQFGCTLIGAAMDDQGRWCLLHLGDGSCIGQLDPSGAWEPISLPQLFLLPGSTSLTMNAPMFHALRFYRHTEPTPQSLVLMTDGAMEHFASCISGDDCSVAWLIMTPDTASN